MNRNFRFHIFQKIALSSFASLAILFYLVGHRLIVFYKNKSFLPAKFGSNYWLFISSLAIFQIFIFLIVFFILASFEKSFKNEFQKTADLSQIGWMAFKYSFVLVILESIFATAVTFIDFTLLNIWDIIFILIFISIFYLGCDFYFYYSIPLDYWKNKDVHIELEKLKLEYDHQKMYLKAFLWITFSIFVSQVFVIMKTRYEPYLDDPIKFSYLMPAIVINGIQISFLILAIWALIFTHLLGRIEEIKLNMSQLNKRKK